MSVKKGSLSGGCLPIILIMIGMSIYYGHSDDKKSQPQVTKEEIIEAPHESIQQNKDEIKEAVADKKIEISPEWMNAFKESISSVLKKINVANKKELDINIEETSALIKSFSVKVDGVEYIGATNSKGAVEYLKKRDSSGEHIVYPVTIVGQQTDKPKVKVASSNNNNVKLAGKNQIRRLNDYLKPGYAIVDTSRVYYKVSNDYNNAYFVGTMIRSNYSGDLYPCIWIVNSEDFNGVMLSANKYATETSYPMDANKTQIHVSTHSDGYSAILEKVNKHFGELIP